MGLHERVAEVMADNGNGYLGNSSASRLAIRAAEAEVKLRDEQHAKENAELKAEYLRLIGDVAYHSNKWQTLEEQHAKERAEWEAERDAAFPAAYEQGHRDALAAENERIFKESASGAGIRATSRICERLSRASSGN